MERPVENHCQSRPSFLHPRHPVDLPSWCLTMAAQRLVDRLGVSFFRLALTLFCSAPALEQVEALRMSIVLNCSGFWDCHWTSPLTLGSSFSGRTMWSSMVGAIVAMGGGISMREDSRCTFHRLP
jgi:hypothetical protein